MGHSEISVRSVDSAQGSESSVVILSTTRPGGKYGLGFLADRKRSCVALSRAQSCLVIVTWKDMSINLSVEHLQSKLPCGHAEEIRMVANITFVVNTSRSEQPMSN